MGLRLAFGVQSLPEHLFLREQAVPRALKGMDSARLYVWPAGQVSGYQRSFRVSMDKDSSTWKRSLRKRFYITLRGGKLFGSMDVNLSEFYQTSPTGLTMDVVINPTGSKSLEK